MINFITHIYSSEDLNGEIFLRPLKAYNHSFHQTIQNHSGLKRVVGVIIHLAAGILVYPFLTGLGGVGCFIKLFGISGIRKHNECEKVYLVFANATKTNQIKDLFCDLIPPGWEMATIQEFAMTKENSGNIHETIEQAIDLFTGQFRKVYLVTTKSPEEVEDQVRIELQVLQRQSEKI